MSTNYYDLDGIIEHLVNELEDITARIENWEKVSFPTKKDGKPFANMAKNIKGAIYKLESYAIQPGEYEITLYYFTIKGGHKSETIKAHNLIKYMSDPEMLAKKENYQPKQTYLEQVYIYDLDDIKKAIKNHIEYLKECKTDLENEIKAAPAALEFARQAYNNYRKELSNMCGDTKHYNYLLQDIIGTVERTY